MKWSEPKPVRWETHTPTKVKFMHWPMCSKCGLVYLKNDTTASAIKKGHAVYADEGK